MERAEVERRLAVAKAAFLKLDYGLLQVAAHERSMTARFSRHVQSEFPEWDVDCEYDMNGDVRKELRWPHTENKPKLVIPDIIVHRQGTPNNLLAIEAKKSGNDNASDRAKLIRFMVDEAYRYRYAALLLFVTGPQHNIEIELL